MNIRNTIEKQRELEKFSTKHLVMMLRTCGKEGKTSRDAICELLRSRNYKPMVFTKRFGGSSTA